jgi:DNA mismatch repair protein MutS2
VQIPDLLELEPHLGVDHRQLTEILGMAFLGREMGTQLHDALANAQVPPSSFRPEFFADDLFLRSLIASCYTLTIGGRSYPVNQEFLFRCLAHPPSDVETICFRQQILRELEEDDGIRDATYQLYRDLFDLMSLMKAPGYQAHLDVAAFHLDILEQARRVIDLMASGFASARSGLRRLHDAAAAIQAGPEYRTLRGLLDYESGMARLVLDVTVGGDGRLRRFAIRELEEASDNPFHRRPLARLFDRVRLAYRGYSMTQRELMTRLVHEVFRQVSPALIPLVQLLGHLEFYLTARSFKERAERSSLAVCLAEFDDQRPLRLEALFNPLLLAREPAPIPSDLATATREPVVLITGPNSGGKTRLLQAIGLCQLLGQGGLYVAARRARLPLQDGLFVSLIEEEGASHTEGRLGRELVRIRSLFEELAERSMVILDELCSGTNPSEGVEVFAMVLRLLRQVQPTAFVTTHFLDFARSLERDPVIPNLELLQAEIDSDSRSTYQFVPGVAETSLAALTAQRLGVTFERLSERIRSQRGPPQVLDHPRAHDAPRAETALATPSDRDQQTDSGKIMAPTRETR